MTSTGLQVRRSRAATAAFLDVRRPSLLAVAALATTLMLEATRVFLSYMVFVVDQSKRETLAGIAFGVFLAFGLAPLLVRLFGTGNAVLLAGSGLVLFRVVLQFWEAPGARLWLGAAAVLCWGWLLPPLLARDRDATAIGVGVGLALDLGIRIAFRTVDLPWMPTAPRDLVTVVLAGALVAALAGSALATAPDLAPGHRDALPLVAVGPVIVLYHLTTGNLGLAQVKTDLAFPWASALLALGFVLGLASTPVVLRANRWLAERLTISLLTALGLWLFWNESALSPLGLVVGSAGAVALLVAVLVGSAGTPGGTGVGAISLWLTLGMVLHAGILFAYFTFTGEPRLVAVALALLVVGALLPARPEPRHAMHPVSLALRPIGAVAVALLAVCAWQAVAWSEPEPGPPLGPGFTAMTYNIQTGFSVENDWSLEATARTIEAQDPDVVVLQEVSRGWLVTSGVDEALWLSDRLDMPFVFGASARDGLWGNAVLSRAPIASSAVHRYSSTQNLERGAIEVELRTEAGGLWVFGTHLDNPRGAGEIRLEQVNQLLGYAEGRSPALIMGDLNAVPDSDVLAACARAGFADPGVALGPDAFTSENGRRIDYILVTPDVSVVDIRIPETWTSDHKPVAADLTLASAAAEDET